MGSTAGTTGSSRGSSPKATTSSPVASRPMHEALVAPEPLLVFEDVRKACLTANVVTDDGGQDLLDANIFTVDGYFKLDVPDGRRRDLVRVSQFPYEGRPQGNLLQLRAGAKGKPRPRDGQRQTFTIEQAEPGLLSLVSTRQSTRLGQPMGQVWFRNERDGDVRSVRLDEHGRLPDDFRLAGEITDTFRVKTLAEPVKKLWNWKPTRYLAAAIHDGADFDHDKMVAHNGPIHAGKIDWNEPAQGITGNCWLVASLIAIAKSRPEFIENMIKPLDNGWFQVTFQKYDHEQQRYVPETTKVSSKLWRQHGYVNHGSTTSDNSIENMPMWFPLIEKAYAQLRGSYEASSSGFGIQAFERLLGTQPQWLGHNETSHDMAFRSMVDAVADRQPIYTQTPKTFAVGKQLSNKRGRSLVANHAYAVVDAFVEEGARYVTIRNPWANTGPNGGRATGIFTLSAQDYFAAFDGTAIGRFPDE